MRLRIAAEAARRVERGEDIRSARYRAARRIAGTRLPEGDLPTADEVRRELGRDGGRRTGSADRFDRLAELLRPLSSVRQDPVRHPEGDALEHALQVFDLVREDRPFDEELLTAALVHDVGRVIDRGDPVAAGLEALGGLVTERTRWLVESLPAARAHAAGTLGHRARSRLESHPDFLDVLLLADADRRGTMRGVATSSLEEAIAFLRGLDAAD